MKKRWIVCIMAIAMLMSCLVPCDAQAAISSVGEGSLVTKKVQNNSDVGSEQLVVETNGSVLSISGKTQLAPLECSSGEQPIYVTSFKNLETKAFGSPYIAMKPVETKDSDGKIVYHFSGSSSFVNVPDGTYVMYLWRGKIGTDKKYDFGSSWGKGILSYDTVIRVTSGNVKIVHYGEIMAENQRVIEMMNANGTERFKDKTLKDIFFVNRDPRKSGDRGNALTAKQVEYITKRAEEITKDCNTEYEKIKAIYEFTAEQLYYDVDRAGKGKTFANPYVNLYNMDEKVNNGYNSSNGKASAECTGYAAMVIALSRSLGIPARLVVGVHPAIENIQWTQVKDLKNENHYWAECYVNGRWVMADATMGTQNKYDHSEEKWTTTGVSNYTYFDPASEQIAVHYLILGIYQVDTPVITTVKGLKTVSRGNTSIKVSWNKMTGAKGLTGYHVRCLSSSGKVLGGMHVTNGTSYTFKKLGAGKTYTIQVRGYGVANGEKTYGKYTSIKTCTKPSKVIIKTPSTDTKHSITVKWGKRTCTGYQVAIATNSKFTKKLKTSIISKSGTTSKKFTSMKKGTTYYVKVRAYQSVNGKKYYGSWSNYKKIKCK